MIEAAEHACSAMTAWLQQQPEWPAHPTNPSGSVSSHFGPAGLSEHNCVLHFARFLNDWTDTQGTQSFIQAVKNGATTPQFLLGSLFFGQLYSLQPVKVVPRFGAPAAAAETGTPYPGVRLAVGVWYSHSAHTIIGVVVVDSASAHTVKQLNSIAKIAVPAFGL